MWVRRTTLSGLLLLCSVDVIFPMLGQLTILDMYSLTREIWSKMLLSREQDLFNLQLKLELCSSVLHQKR